MFLKITLIRYIGVRILKFTAPTISSNKFNKIKRNIITLNLAKKENLLYNLLEFNKIEKHSRENLIMRKINNNKFKVAAIEPANIHKF